MRRNQAVLTITDEQRSELSKWAASRTLPAGDVFRARLILALAERRELSADHGDVANDSTDDLALETEV